MPCELGLEENEANKLTPLVGRGVLASGRGQDGMLGMVSNLGRDDHRGEEFSCCSTPTQQGETSFGNSSGSLHSSNRRKALLSTCGGLSPSTSSSSSIRMRNRDVNSGRSPMQADMIDASSDSTDKSLGGDFVKIYYLIRMREYQWILLVHINCLFSRENISRPRSSCKTHEVMTARGVS